MTESEDRGQTEIQATYDAAEFADDLAEVQVSSDVDRRGADDAEVVGELGRARRAGWRPRG